jgi:hypothetical protein
MRADLDRLRRLLEEGRAEESPLRIKVTNTSEGSFGTIRMWTTL